MSQSGEEMNIRETIRRSVEQNMARRNRRQEELREARQARERERRELAEARAADDRTRQEEMDRIRQGYAAEQERLREEAERQRQLSNALRQEGVQMVQQPIQGNPLLTQAVQQAAAQSATDQMMQREIESRNEVLAAGLDPEVNRIAGLFYASLMTMIAQEFGYNNPMWDHLGWREKKAWLAACKVVVEELRKTPILPGAAIGRRHIES